MEFPIKRKQLPYRMVILMVRKNVWLVSALKITVGITSLVLVMTGAASVSEGSWVINDSATGGDCNSIGTWNASSKTCTLTTNLTETIEIYSDGITLDGSGHTITGSYRGSGIYLSGRNGVTIKNTNIRNFFYGIFLSSSSNSTLSGNNANSNEYNGIILSSSSNNMLSGNNASYNLAGIELSFLSNNNMMNGNNASNNDYGIELDLASNNNTLSGNNASSNGNHGIWLGSSDKNTLSSNNANSNNYYGIYLEGSSSNMLSGNIASNNWGGIYLDSFGDNNMLSGNNATSNTYGIYLYASSSNSIYNNFFNNTNNFGISNSVNRWNITKTGGKNIIGGSYLGGNFWANPNGTGFSQTCVDANGDGICDSAYTLDSNNIDYLPLSMNFTPLSGSIIGKFAYSNNGTGIVGVTVNLTNASGVVVTTTTNSSGGYSFTNVLSGNYNINASKPGFFGNSTALVTAVTTNTVYLILWMKGDLNNNGIPGDAGDLVLMKRAAIGEITPGSNTATAAFTYDLNNNGIRADAGDLVLMKRAAIGEIILP